MAKKQGLAASYDELPLILRLILSIIAGFIVGAVYRILKGRLLVGIIWLITGGFFGIGWIIDVVTIVLNGKITFLA